MKIKTKLMLGFGTILVILLFISVNVLLTLNKQNNNMEKIVTNYYEKVVHAQLLKHKTQDIGRMTRDLLLVEERNQEILELISQNFEKSSLALESIGGSEFSDITLITDLNYLHTAYQQQIESVISEIEMNNYQRAKELLYGGPSPTRQHLLEAIHTYTEHVEAVMDGLLSESAQAYQYNFSFYLVFFSVSILVAVAVVGYVIDHLTKSISTISTIMNSVPEYSFDNLPRVSYTSKDELADVSIAYNNLAEVIETFALKEKQIAEKLMEENWVKTKYAEILTPLQGSLKIESFGSSVMMNVAKIVKSTYGAFYLKKTTNCLTKLASYADAGEKANQELKIGEGLTGQCALNNELIYLEKLPENYVRTKSSLGEGLPTSLIILPIPFEGEVIGTIELAKFEPFTLLEKELLQQIAKKIGTNINRILNHMEIDRLLVESQIFTEELQAQSEELQQQQEELRMINEELHAENKLSEEKTQQLIQIKTNLEEKNKEVVLNSKYKSEFLANMSHELRTPLNSMLILAQILSENRDGNLSEQQVQYARTIYSSGNDLLELINDILDLSKVESGKVDVFPEEVLINDIKGFVKRQFTPIAEDKGLDFHIRIDHDTPSIIFTDDQRLKQILKNLLSNAFKFTSRGSVTLHMKKRKEHQNSGVIFSVIDTGIGIAKYSQESIFTAFNQVDGTTSRNYGGTGLGLSISRDLCNLLGGHIEVESIEGEGSCFSLHLPNFEASLVEEDSVIDFVATSSELADDSEFDASTTLTDGPNFENFKVGLENKKILIVDDDMRNVFAITSALEKQNMKVIFAENGKEAIDILQQSTADIVLMDIMMPEMNGYEAMREIRKQKRNKDLPIIAITAKAMRNDREKCLNAGASDYISKPVNMEQLLSLIKVWLYKG